MKITAVKTVLLTGPCTNDPYLSEARKRRSAAFVEILTDTEITGLGETYAGYFIPEIVPEIVRFFEPILVGQNPEEIDLLWRRMYHCGNFWCRTGVGLQVLSAIEAALWDIRGKCERLPVYRLLSEVRRESLPCYATGGPANYPLEKLYRKLEYYRSLGFTAAKIGAGQFEEGRTRTSRIPEKAAEIEYEKVTAIRRRFGGEFTLMLDGHMGNWPDFDTVWTLPVARAVMTALAGSGLLFFEEPLHYNDREGYRALRAESPVPIAGGEALAGEAEWEPYYDGCFEIGQPDAAYFGGLSQFLRIARSLDRRGSRIATHSWAAGGGFMQNVHAGFAAPNTEILEIAPDYGPLHSEIIGESFRMEGGRVLPPETYGLGITLSEKVREKYPFLPGSGEFNSVPGKILRD